MEINIELLDAVTPGHKFLYTLSDVAITATQARAIADAVYPDSAVVEIDEYSPGQWELWLMPMAEMKANVYARLDASDTPLEDTLRRRAERGQ